MQVSLHLHFSIPDQFVRLTDARNSWAELQVQVIKLVLTNAGFHDLAERSDWCADEYLSVTIPYVSAFACTQVTAALNNAGL